MTTTTERHPRARLQLSNLEATVWESYKIYGQGRPDELAFTFTIERLNTSTIQDANEYQLEDIEGMIHLTRWAEAQVHHFGEEVL